MPKLTLVGRNVCGHPSRFVLRGFLEEPSGITAPDGAVLIELDTELEPVICIESENVAAGETFKYEDDLEVTFDMRGLQWAAPGPLCGRFELVSFTWGEHKLIRQPGMI
ncbi:hypothetical protein LCGC14_0982130 [marine sediment metagenome]|uniref:Uncharacterized protein n=1 Tax=marine sediment metagenome TaxID=412755 RepID=A0A0F9QRQ5_9ZZZZ